MSRRTALVVGGTGPTGPAIVSGLVTRDFDVTIFHSGTHEVDFETAVEHIHGDPHFVETISAALGRRTWDVAVIQYGRLIHLVEALAGNVSQIIGIGGANRILVAADDPAWGGTGKPAIVSDDVFADSAAWFEHDRERNSFGVKMRDAHARLFERAVDGEYDATYIAYPLLFGPRQPACREWSVVRRILDGRRRIVLADDGLKLQSVGYTENVALAPLLAIDQPSVAAGQTYFVADRDLLTYRRRVEVIARLLGTDVEVVGLPYEIATPCHALYGAAAGHRAIHCQRVRDDLGYVDTWETNEALGRTVDWLVGLSPTEIAELEDQLGDPFDYQAEDALLARWDDVRPGLVAAAPPTTGLAHPYRHPGTTGEAWVRREFDPTAG